MMPCPTCGRDIFGDDAPSPLLQLPKDGWKPDLPAPPSSGLVERLLAAAWDWGHDCEVDDIHDRNTKGDSHNERQRDDTKKAALAINVELARLTEAFEQMRLSRDRTRAALEAKRLDAATAIEALQAENERLREALQPFVQHYDPEWMDAWADEENCTVFSRVTFGQVRRAREAISPRAGEG